MIPDRTPKTTNLWVWAAFVFLCGYAGQLWLTAPLWLGFIRVRPYEFSETSHWIALGAIALQFLVAWSQLWRQRKSSSIKGCLAGVSLAMRCVTVAVFGFAAIQVTLLVPRWGEDGTVLLLITRLAVALALATTNGLSLWQLGRVIPRLWQRASDSQVRRLPWFLAVFVLILTGSISQFVYEGLPHIPDEAAYLFQAECLADGQLQSNAPAVPEALDIYLIDSREGHWRAVTNPGWPALLAVGVLVGLEGWVNPLLAALCVLLTHRLMQNVGNVKLANIATILLATSPWFLFLGGSIMTHMLTLFCLLGSMVLVFGEHRRPLAAGLLLGWLFTVRPLDGILASVLIFTTLLWTRRVNLRGALGFCIGCALTGSLLLFFNHALMGSFTTTPINDYIDRLWYTGANSLGFGSTVGNPVGGWGLLDPITGHGWRDVLLNLNQNTYNLNFEFMGCGAGSLLLLMSHAVWGRWSRRDRMALGAVVAIAGLYSLYWFSGGPDFGARYWFLMLPSLLWLSARGIETLCQRTGQPSRIHGALLVSIVATLFLFVPWRCVTRYHDYRGVNSDIQEAMDAGQFGNAVVLIDDKKHSGSLYRSAFFLNHPSLPPERPIFVRDLGPESQTRLKEAFPNRELLRWTGDGCETVR